VSNSHIQLNEPLAAYLREILPHEPDVLRRLREETARLPHGGMQITPEQGQFMRLLVRMLGARKTLEIGVFTGYSSTCVALALPADGQLIACDLSAEWTDVARRYWREAGVESRIRLHLGPAVQTLQRLVADGEAGTFDFAFIDADKENYQTYFDYALTLLRSGGVAAVDNVLWHGRVVDMAVTDADTEAIRTFNRRLKADPRVSISTLPIGDGLTLAMKL
jgi:caffeoyl-CoA O-methyltransferase